ncbi:hypothetical protein ATCC90586_009552 [Pythium insidiosum]|nr:hypothetical protein ATCC90586_009552 [Pythium insidiosum]
MTSTSLMRLDFLQTSKGSASCTNRFDPEMLQAMPKLLHDKAGRVKLVNAGIIAVLMECLDESNDSLACHEALWVLQTLAVDVRTHGAFADSCVIARFLLAIKRNVPADTSAVMLQILQVLVISPQLQRRFIEHNGVQVMLHLLQTGGKSEKEAAALLLWIVANDTTAHDALAASETTATLVGFLRHSNDDDLLDAALATLLLLAEHDACLLQMRQLGLSQLLQSRQRYAREVFAMRSRMLHARLAP